MDFTYHCIDDVLSLNNANFGEYVDRIYPIEHEIKHTTGPARSVSYLDVHLEIESRHQVKNETLRQDSIFHLYARTLQQHLHMEYLSFS